MLQPLFSCINSWIDAPLRVITRAILILISAYIYQSFVWTEVLLYGFQTVYPPYLAKPISRIHGVLSSVVTFVFRVIAVEVIYCRWFILLGIINVVDLLAQQCAKPNEVFSELTIC